MVNPFTHTFYCSSQHPYRLYISKPPTEAEIIEAYLKLYSKGKPNSVEVSEESSEESSEDEEGEGGEDGEIGEGGDAV